MKYQQPAEGIVKTGEWTDAKSYRVVCTCGSDSHNHDLFVEADDHHVTVTLYTTVTSRFWSMTRWKQIWKLLTKGYVEYQAELILTEQQAFNYSETLTQAVKDVEKNRKKASE